MTEEDDGESFQAKLIAEVGESELKRRKKGWKEKVVL